MPDYLVSLVDWFPTINWSEVFSTTIGGVIAALVGGGTAFAVERWRRSMEENRHLALQREERIAVGQAALVALGLQFNALWMILGNINRYRAEAQRWRDLPDVAVPLVVQATADPALLVFLAAGTNATPENAALLYDIGKSQSLVAAAISIVAQRRGAYAEFLEAMAIETGNPRGALDVPVEFFTEQRFTFRTHNSFRKLSATTDALYEYTDVSYEHTWSTMQGLHTRLRVEFPDQRFVIPAGVPASPADVPAA